MNSIYQIVLNKKISNMLFLFAGLIFLSLIFSHDVYASSAQGLPWEGPLDKIKASITGPVAGAISFLGIVVAGMMLIWGGEMSDFTKRLVYVVLVISIILGAAVLINLWQGGGAVIPATLIGRY